jgi:hypothetical protein
MRTVVVNINDPGSQAFIAQAKHAGRFVAVHRPTRWGNPFSHLDRSAAAFKVETVEEAITCYTAWLLEQPELLADLPTLRGKVLGCFCAPRPCHARVLAGLADDA